MKLNTRSYSRVYDRYSSRNRGEARNANQRTISNQTIYFGAETFASAGGAKAIASDGSEVNITAVTPVSGVTSGWTHSSGRLIRTTGTPAASNGAVLSCATSLGTINVTISTIADAYSVASIAEIQTVINLARDATNPGSYTTALANKTMYTRPGSYDTRDDNVGVTGLKGTMTYRGAFLNQTGTFTVRPHGAQWSTIFNFWRLWIPDNLSPSTNRVGDITFKDIQFFRSMNSFKTQMRGGQQEVSACLIQHDYGTGRNITFDGCKFASDMEAGRTGAFKNYSHYPIAIQLQTTEGATVKNCLFTNLGSGIRSIAGDDWLVENNEFCYNKADFCNIGATNFTIRGNIIHNFTSDGVYHPDFIQGFNANSGPGVIEGNVIYPGIEMPLGLKGSAATEAVLDGNRVEYGPVTGIITNKRWSVPFSSGGTKTIVAGNTITGVTSLASGIVDEISLTSGSWAAGTAAGFFILRDVTGTFGNENVKEGAGTDDATVTSAVVSVEALLKADGTIIGGASNPTEINGKTISVQNQFLGPETSNTFTLPPLSTLPAGFMVSFCKRNGTEITIVINPDAGNTINGGAISSVTLDEFYESVRFVKQSSTNWTATMDDARNGPVRRFADFTLTNNDWSRVFCVDATAGPVTVNLPQASTLTSGQQFEIHKFDPGSNTVTIVPYPGDTYLDQDGVAKSTPIVLYRIGRMRGFLAAGTSQWTINDFGGNGEPQPLLMQSTGSESYSDITVRGNLWWFSAGHSASFQSSPAETSNIKIYNNTFVTPLVGDADGDGLMHKSSDGTTANPAPYAIAEDLNTYIVRNVCTAPSSNLVLDNYTSVTPATLSSYTDFFAGNNTDTDFYPLTLQQAIDMARPRSAANVKYGAVGTTDTNGYWNFATRSANVGFGDAPTILNTTPSDNSIVFPANQNIVINFSQPIAKGTGNIVLRENNSGWSDLATYDAASSARLTWEGNRLTIDPASDLTVGREHAIRIASTAVVSELYGTAFAGIADDTTLSFTAITPPPPNLITGSNVFSSGTRVWALLAGTGTMTLTSGPAVVNSVTGETYWNYTSTSGGTIWRYDTNDADDTFSPAGSTQYTFSFYVKKGTSFNFDFTLRTLGGLDRTSYLRINTTTWANGSGAIDADHNATAGDGTDFTDLGGNEGRFRVTITTPASTNRILWELEMPASQNIMISSAMIHAGSGFATYSNVG